MYLYLSEYANSLTNTIKVLTAVCKFYVQAIAIFTLCYFCFLLYYLLLKFISNLKFQLLDVLRLLQKCTIPIISNFLKFNCLFFHGGLREFLVRSYFTEKTGTSLNLNVDRARIDLFILTSQYLLSKQPTLLKYWKIYPRNID